MAKKNFKTKGFSYHIENDRDTIKHIENQPNQSSYILNLVRKDMDGDNLELIVKKYVEELLENKEIKSVNKKANNISKDNIVDLLNIGML